VAKVVDDLNNYLNSYYNVGEWDTQDLSNIDEADVADLNGWVTKTRVAGALLLMVW